MLVAWAIFPFLPSKPLAASSKPLTILVLGDSLTAGYGLSKRASFPARLEELLSQAGVEARVVNAGVSGDTSAQGLARLDWLLAEKPDAAIVELGANDGLRGLSPEAMERNLDAVIERLQGEGVPVLLAGMYASPNMGEDYVRRYNAVFPRLAEKYGVVFVPFFLEGVAGNPALNQPDGIHPNEEGTWTVARRLMPQVLELVRRVGEVRNGAKSP